ncbi:MAG TPA: glycosyltransferase family 39 protein [Chloroflexia bacterium]|nr:glycosyltransferase family 39 protein [Chloroflexia bacterium]
MRNVSPVTLSGSSRVSGDRPIKKLPQILCGVFLLLYILFFAIRAIAALLYAYPLEYGEGAVFHESAQLFRDHFAPGSLYPANDAMPYRAGIYTPLFYYLQALTMFITGPASMLGGRLITLAASLYIGISLYRVSRREPLATGRPAGYGISLAAAITPFATSALYGWGVLAKGDVLAIALSLAAILRIYPIESEWRRGQTPRPFVLAGILCGLALLTKQSALAAPAAILIWLGIQRQWREAGGFLAAMLAVVGVTGIFFQLATGGAFFKHIVTYNSQPYDFEFLWQGLLYFVPTHIVLLVLAFVWLLRPLIGRYERIGLWRIYFVTALLLSFSIGKVGANFNYYIEILCLVSLFGWWQLGRIMALRPELPFRLGSFRVGLAPVVLVLMVFQLFNLHHVPFVADGANTPGPSQFSQSTEVAAEVRTLEAHGPLLAEDAGWQAALGLPVELDDPFVFGQLAQEGSWNSQPFLDKLKSGYFKAAFYKISQADTSEMALDQAVKDNTAAPFPRQFSPEVLQVLQDRSKFVPVKRIGPYLFLAWKEQP